MKMDHIRSYETTSITEPAGPASRFLDLPRFHEIRLCCLNLPSLPLEPMLPFLTVEERRGDEQGRRYRKDFEYWLKARAGLRYILASCTGLPPRGVPLLVGLGKKPELAENSSGLHFNVARSRNYALIAVGRVPLGVDIQAIRPDFSWETIATYWFHPRERMLLATTPEAHRVDIFFQIWTKKEAFFKGIGMGLDREAMTACFTTAHGRSIRGFHPSLAQHWWVKALAAPPGYKASLSCLEGAHCIIDCTGDIAEALQESCRTALSR